MWKELDSWSDELNIKMQKRKDRYLRPILFCLKKIGFTADGLSTLKIVMAMMAAGIAKWNVPIAVIIFLMIYILDVFDGSLARYMGQNSDRGKFIDVFSDQAVYAVVILTLIWIDFVSIKALAFNLLAVPVLYLLVVIQRNEDRPTDWIIKPVAKLGYYKTPFLATVVGTVIGFWDLTLVHWTLCITNILVSLHIIYVYMRIVGKNK
ncbi:MAG TPA: CDP-alcohol phosphatidyltransferase family protein [Patescibacteria group bacterium]|nr:CDP-alcohol phosphatidyltransferase family protein [Patescibacteria group bacterium]